MAHSIDDTLARLQDAMNAHRKAMEHGPSARPSSTELALPEDRRAQLVLRLLVGVEARAGIEVSQPSAEKLLRLLAGKDIAELDAWVSRMEALPASDPEWLSLIESLTVHETYVMRDPSQLGLFAAQLPDLIAAAEAAKFYRLRFWSAGCATGEEAYSIAALAFDALIAAGKASATETGTTLLPPWRVEVTGSDISRRALTKARAGVYDTGPLSSFRAESAVVLRHFPSVSDTGTGARRSASRVASPDLKAAVHFEHLNIVNDQIGVPAFDAVFCRNVLIYFSARARRRALERLTGAVRGGGYLVLGPTDALIDAGAFETVWAPDAVIYRRRTADA